MPTLSMSLISSLVFASLLALTSSAPRALANEGPLEKEPRRLALVVGNPDYDSLVDIPSSAVDVRQIAEALKDLGFEVTKGTFTSRSQFEDDLLVPFREKANFGDLVVIYFSGHGFSHGPFTYLASTAIAQPVVEMDLLDSAVALEELEDFFSCPPKKKLGCRSPGLLVFVIDACRTFTAVNIKRMAGDQVVAKGTPAPEQANSATNFLIAFAARPGSPASGTTAANEPSIFTKHLVPVLGMAGMDLEEVIEEAATAVLLETRTQNPGKTDWSKVRAFLRPTDQILADERKAWEAAVGSGQRLPVEYFLIRHAISRYAAAARKWLAEHPTGVSAGGYTLASPVAIDRAWRVDSEESVAVRRTQLPLGFPRLIEQNLSAQIRDLSDVELGLVPSGTTARDLRQLVATGGEQLPFDAAATEALGVAVALREETAFLESAAGVDIEGKRMIDIPAGTSLRVLSVERSDNNGITVRARVPYTEWPVRVSLSRSVAVEPLELGQSLLEIAVPPSEGLFFDLANTASLEETTAQLRGSGHVLTWVSLAAGRHRENEDPEDLAARVAHVRHVLSRNGIDSRRVTAIMNMDEVPEGVIRVRFFGYQKGG